LDIPLFQGFLGYPKVNEILFALSATSGAITVSHFFKEIQTEGTKIGHFFQIQTSHGVQPGGKASGNMNFDRLVPKNGHKSQQS
jgi:hypothetical protein